MTAPIGVAGSLPGAAHDWAQLAHRVGRAQARVGLTLFYVAVVAPLAVAVRALADPLRLGAPPAWLPRERPDGQAPTQARSQY